MANLNKIILQGRLTADPELKTSNTGTNLCKFSIASQNMQKKVDFWDIVAWNKNAETVSKFFRKGQPIVVVGNIYHEDFTDKDGKCHRKVVVNASEVYFCESKAKGDDNGNNIADDITPVAEDDLPF